MDKIAVILKNIILKYASDDVVKNLKIFHYTRLLKKIHKFKEEDLRILDKIVNRGDFVVDIGANFGLYTTYMSNIVGKCGSVISIEPIPITFEILSKCMSNLNIENVKLLNYAISDKDDIVVMVIPGYENGGENYYMAKIIDDSVSKNNKYFKVFSRKLDTILSDVESCDFVKIDVEGHEYKVIKGALYTLLRCKPVIMIEVSGNPDDTSSEANQLFKLLENIGYDFYYNNNGNLTRRPIGCKSINYFMLPIEKASKILDSGPRVSWK